MAKKEEVFEMHKGNTGESCPCGMHLCPHRLKKSAAHRKEDSGHGHSAGKGLTGF